MEATEKHSLLNALAERAKAGDKDAEERLYVELSGLVFFLSRRYNIKGAEADDVFQEGFMAIHGAIEGYQPSRGSFYTYCRQCIENKLSSSVKASCRNKHRFLNGYISLYSALSEDNDDELVESIAGDGVNPGDELIRQEEIDELKKKIDLKLTVLEKSVLSCYLDGLSYQETAEVLRLTVKAVDNALTRIKKKLGATNGL